MSTQPSLSRRLAPIRQIAESRENDAARQLAESQRQLAQQEKQLHEMERYLREYSESRPAGAVAPALLANREAFLRQLAEALRWQAGAVADARQRLQQARDNWLGKHRDTDVLDHLIERSRGDELRAQERRQQRELDEFANLRASISPLAG
jgi:flagellar FliJ protein